MKVKCNATPRPKASQAFSSVPATYNADGDSLGGECTWVAKRTRCGRRGANVMKSNDLRSAL